MVRRIFVSLALVASVLCNTVWAGNIIPPDVPGGGKRSITVDDVSAIRDVASLRLSPDGRRFAAWIYQGDPSVNAYTSGLFIGDVSGGHLTFVGDGGPGRPRVMFTGHVVSDIAGPDIRWSPDGRWIAYTRHGDDGTQLWRSRVDGSRQEQITHNPGDVRSYVWRADGRALLFQVSPPRAQLAADAEARAREGYRYDEDLWSYTDFLFPQLIVPPKTETAVWIVTSDGKRERIGADADRAAFEQALDVSRAPIKDAAGPAVARAGGGWAWPVATAPRSQIARLQAALTDDISKPIVCSAAACTGTIRKVMWSGDGRRVLFWRGEGINDSDNGFYAWDPATGDVSTALRIGDDKLRLCEAAPGDQLICVRETAARPAHIVAVDFGAGAVRDVADINPEFRNIRLGKVERFEWDTPSFRWSEPGGALAGLYPKRTYGHIIYPPDFDPSKTYPVFVDPYVASGFNPLGAEHALHVYAANGFVVLRTAFPLWIDRNGRGVTQKQLYSVELGFPHLTMLMESTVKGIDTAAARGFIDTKRIGIGGVSHGTFVPLYMMQKHDRIAAISISSPSWGPIQNYGGTRKARDTIRQLGQSEDDNWLPKPGPEAHKFWLHIDITEHVDKIEGPILMNLVAQETYALTPFIRALADADRPYDAYVFNGETHTKWQSAHLHNIMARNVDWFRFWLKGEEDAGPTKAEQYTRWRKLRTRQCELFKAANTPWYCAQ